MLAFTYLHTLGVKGRVPEGLGSWGRSWGRGCSWLGSLLLGLRLLGRHVALGFPVEVGPKNGGKVAPEREDGRLEGLPLLLFWVGAPTEGLVRAGTTAADYKRKRHQQGAADISLLSPVRPPPLSPHPNPHAHTSLLTACTSGTDWSFPANWWKPREGQENRPSPKR